MSTSARKAARKAAQTPSSHSTVVSLLNSMQKKNAHSTHKKARSHSTLTNLMNYSNKQWGIVCYTRDESVWLLLRNTKTLRLVRERTLLL